MASGLTKAVGTVLSLLTPETKRNPNWVDVKSNVPTPGSAGIQITEITNKRNKKQKQKQQQNKTSKKKQKLNSINQQLSQRSRIGRPFSERNFMAPTNLGKRLTNVSSFAFAGKAQQVTDRDPGGSLRIMGSERFYVQPYFFNGSAGATGSYAFSTGSGNQTWATVAPSTVSLRLKQFEALFEWYAFRSLKFEFVPCIPTSVAGTYIIGISDDINITADIAGPTVTQVSQLSPSVMSSVWSPLVISAPNKGTKLFSCHDSSGEAPDNIDRFQYAVCMNGEGAPYPPSGTISAFYQIATCIAHYVCDFYDPTIVQTASENISSSISSTFSDSKLKEKGCSSISSSVSSSSSSSSLKSLTTPLLANDQPEAPDSPEYHLVRKSVSSVTPTVSKGVGGKPPA